MPNPTPELREALKEFDKPFRFSPMTGHLIDNSMPPKTVLRLSIPSIETSNVIFNPIGEYLAACLNEAAKEK